MNPRPDTPASPHDERPNGIFATAVPDSAAATTEGTTAEDASVTQAATPDPEGASAPEVATPDPEGSAAAQPHASVSTPPHRASRVIRFMSHTNQVKWVIAGKAALCGVIVGVLVVAYRVLLAWGTGRAVLIYRWLHGRPLWIAGWCALAVAAGLLIGWMVKKVPMASGSGIPQVEGVLLKGLHLSPLPILAVRYLGGGLCSLFGMSLGREGPSIQIGAAGSQLLSRKIRGSHSEGRLLVAGGAAAGLSAAFNAPLSGMMFALEEVYRSFSPLVLLSAAAASLVADFVSKNWFGLTPVLDFSSVPQMPVWNVLWMLPLGIVVGLIGSLTNRVLLGAQTLYGKLPWQARAPIGLLIAVCVGMLFPYALGGGESMIGISESLTMSLGMLVLLMVVKMVFTATSFGSGVPGGIFMPILAIGTACGAACGMAVSLLGLIPMRYVTAFAVYGMAAALAASVKAPVTAIMLTVEMTGSLVHMLPVALCAFTALFVSDLLHTKPIYTELLDRYMRSHEGSEHEQHGNAIMEFPVEPGSMADGALVGSLDLPASARLVTILRGPVEVIPYGSTRVEPGDYLVLVFPTVHTQSVNEAMTRVCKNFRGATRVNDSSQ